LNEPKLETDKASRREKGTNLKISLPKIGEGRRANTKKRSGSDKRRAKKKDQPKGRPGLVNGEKKGQRWHIVKPQKTPKRRPRRRGAIGQTQTSQTLPRACMSQEWRCKGRTYTELGVIVRSRGVLKEESRCGWGGAWV